MAKKRKGLIAVAWAAALGGAAISVISKLLFKTTVVAEAKWTYGGANAKKEENNKEEDKEQNQPEDKYAAAIREAKEYYRAQEMEEVWIRSTIDDTGLHAKFFPADEPKRFVLMAHGYRANAEKDFAGSAAWFHENGCSLLFIDERCCGKSEGRFITFGAREKYDVLDWLDWIEAHNGAGLPVYLYGISMGSATVMSASEYVLPETVAGMIADCGYTSMADICETCVEKWYNMPEPIAKVLLKAVDCWCRNEAGFAMREANPEKALTKCSIPVLFIHGTEDDFVPPEHTERNFNACASEQKEILWIEGAEHAVAWYEDPARYQKAVRKLFRQCEA